MRAAAGGFHLLRSARLRSGLRFRRYPCAAYCCCRRWSCCSRRFCSAPRRRPSRCRPGFVKLPVQGSSTSPSGVTFDPNGRMYVWERAGRVWIVENNVRLRDTAHRHLRRGRRLARPRAARLRAPPELPAERLHLSALRRRPLPPDARRHAGLRPERERGRTQPSIGRITRYTRARVGRLPQRRSGVAARCCWARRASTGCPLLPRLARRRLARLRQRRHAARELRRRRELHRRRRRRRRGGRAHDAGARRRHHHAGRGRRRLPRAAAVARSPARSCALDPQTGDGVPGNPFYDPQRAALRALARVRARLAQPVPLHGPRPTPAATIRSRANPGSLYVGQRRLEHLGRARGREGRGLQLGLADVRGPRPAAGLQRAPDRRTSTRRTRSTTAPAARCSSSPSRT